jgi:molybdenum cofactor cytidylyltransferase
VVDFPASVFPVLDFHIFCVSCLRFSCLLLFRRPERYRPHMARTAAFCGLILAAGESSRMGRDKALLPWPPQPPSNAGDTFLSAAIHLFLDHVDEVLVVAGKNHAELAPIIYASGAALVINPDPDRGQFSSLQTGLQEVLNRGRDAAMVTLVDRPPVRPETIENLQAAFDIATAKRKWAVIPEFEGSHGHPILLGREMLTAFLSAPHSSNARDVGHANQSVIEYVSVDDPLVALNVDTPEQYAALSMNLGWSQKPSPS